MTVRCVVAAVDGSPQSLGAVDWAADEAWRRQVPLRLVHACLWERYERGTEDEDEPLSVRAEVRQLISAAMTRAAERRPSVETVPEVVPGDAVSALLGLGGPAPLLVLGHRGRRGLAGPLLGPVGRRVVAAAGHPVALVPDEPSAPAGRVVLAVDEDGEATAAAAGFAVAEARLRSAELELVHAWRRGTLRSGTKVPIAGATPEERARRLMADLALPGADGLTVHRHSRRGRAVEVLQDAAAGAGLVVLAARRHSPGRLQPGRICRAVLQRARCPVLVVPVG
ncbi:universal stress protein [Kitasatospora paranensis]|uniref:Universal stress protein n=1 Tax=Kitasatospora paranensis TaxID=258053 RepID=A0ABW2FRJ9_9ACTN